jgi:hypothetical protein
MDRLCSTSGKNKKWILKVSLEIPSGNIPLGRPRCTNLDNNEIGSREMRCEDGELISGDSVSTVMNK